MRSMKWNMFMLFGYLIMFAGLFFISLYDYLTNRPIVDIGLPEKVTNLGILVLSFLGIVKTFWHIYRF